MNLNKLLVSTHIYYDSVRFLLAGGINTVATLALYQILLVFFSHTVSYSISWIIGILLVVIYYPTKVFPGGYNSIYHCLSVILIYALVFVMSLWFLGILVKLEVNPRVAIIYVLILSTMLNFLLIRVVYRRLKINCKK